MSPQKSLPVFLAATAALVGLCACAPAVTEEQVSTADSEEPQIQTGGTSDEPSTAQLGDGAAVEDHSVEELAQMSLAEFQSATVSDEQRYQLLWHYAGLSAEHAELFGHQEGLFAYNPINLAHPGNSADNILLQHWYLQQLYRVGEVLAEEHGGEDIALKLAATVDPDGVPQLEQLIQDSDVDPPAWLLSSRFELLQDSACLQPPQGTELSEPWEDQVCHHIEFDMSEGEANAARPYFHWVEFTDDDGEPAGFWDRSAQHWR